MSSPTVPPDAGSVTSYRTGDTVVGRYRGRARTSEGGPVGRVEYWNDPRAPKPNSLVPACGILAADERGHILLQRRRDTGQWAIPMGKMELGETPSQCAIRETLEETGVLAE